MSERPLRVGLGVLLLAATLVLSGAAAGLAPHDTLNTTDATPTPTPTPTPTDSGGLVSDAVDSTTDTLNTTDATPTPTPTPTPTDSGGLVNDTVDSTTSTVNDTVDSTTSTVNDTVDSTTSTVNDTVDTTTDTVDNVTGEATTATGTNDTLVTDVTDDSTGTLDDTTSTLTDTTDTTTATLTDGLDDTTESLLAGVEDPLAVTTSSLDSVTLLDDASLTGEDDAVFTVSEPADDGSTRLAVEDADPATDDEYPAPTDEYSAPTDDTGDTDSQPVAAMQRAPTGSIPAGPVPAAAGATAAVGAGAIAVGAVMGSSGATTGVGRTAGSRALRGLKRLVRMLVPLRYSSYAGSDPLEHEDRAAIYDYVEERPGAYMSAVSEAVGVPHSTARHHVKILDREGLVENAKVRGRRRLFPAHSQQQELAAAMADEPTAAVLESIARLGPCSGSALAEAVDKSLSTVSHHVSRLEDDGLVVREKEGRTTVHRLPAEVQEALAPERDRAGTDPGAVSAD